MKRRRSKIEKARALVFREKYRSTHKTISAWVEKEYVEEFERACRKRGISGSEALRLDVIRIALEERKRNEE